MHNLAIALHNGGHTITGSDDQIFEPSNSRLDKEGILPAKDGWFPDLISDELDAVILGMHAHKDNPELEKAKELGLAERLVEDGESRKAAEDYIRGLAANSAPVSMQVIKAQVYRHLNMPLGEAMLETNDLMAVSLEKDDFREGVRSFIEKRPPKFSRVKG